jgi:O-succinylbenzoic acid--CoA ligase
MEYSPLRLSTSNTAPALYLWDKNGNVRQYSYAEYWERSNSAVVQLQAQGFRVGDRCAFLAPNTENTLLLLLACLRLGITAMPLSPRFPETLTHDLVRLANARFLELSDFTDKNVCATEEEIESNVEIPLERDATILCSSGSTGVPKMFLHTVQNHALSACGSAENIPFGEGDCWLASLPLYHTGGYAIFFRAFVGQAAIALPRSLSFDVASFTESLEQFPITHCSLVATQLYHLLRSNQAVEQLRRLKAILLGGSAIPETLIDQALVQGLRIYTSYGSTEMASQITTTKAVEHEHLRTSGNVLPYRELSISNEGEILVRGGTLAKGRLTEQGIIALTSDDGWYHTRDLGALDSAQRLLVLGRRDNMFISGGENIHPESIERVLLATPHILQAIVVPVPHEIYGFRPVAFVALEGEMTLHSEQISMLQSAVAKHLPRFAVPDAFFSFPQDILASGIKPSRAELRRRAKELIAQTQIY